MKIGIVGLGYVGLPLAVAFAETGHEVVCFDLDSPQARGAAGGVAATSRTSPTRRGAIRERLHPTSRHADLGVCEAVIVCVPTPLTQRSEPDLTYLLSASEEIARVLQPGQLIVLESTTYPGTTREQVAPILEAAGLTVGEDVHLAFSPERIDPGRTDYTVRTTPKLVGGITAECTERGAGALRGDLLSRPSSSPRRSRPSSRSCWRTSSARSTSPWSTSSRSSATGSGIDVWEVIDAASTKPFGFMRFEPGPEWVATASRSTPSTSLTRPPSTTSTRSSSSLPARSTRPSPASAWSGWSGC